MAWTSVQIAPSHNSAGSGGTITLTFSSVNIANNVVAGVISWQGAATIQSIQDEVGNNYWLLGNIFSSTVSGTQINVALFWGIVYTPDTVGVTITTTFSANVTLRYMGGGEFNPGTTYGTNIIDYLSQNGIGVPLGGTSPQVGTVLANLGELLVVGVYTLGRAQTVTAGWTSFGSTAGGQGGHFQVMASVSGSYTASPCTVTASVQTAMAIAALNFINPTAPLPTPPTPTFSPLLAPAAYPLEMGQSQTTSLINALGALAAIQPAANLLDWNGNPYSVANLISVIGSGNSPVLPSTTVEYRPDLGVIHLVSGGLRFGTMFVIQPQGVVQRNTDIDYYSLGGVGIPQDAATFFIPELAGISIRINWATLEPAQGVFNFQFLDSEISRAVAAGLKIILRVSVEGNNAPSWVYAISQYANFSTGKVWSYWDPNGLAAKIAMVQALGQRYGSLANLQIVAAACDTTTSGDWSCPHTPSDITLWGTLGYTTQKNIDACNYVIQQYAAAFPNQIITLACGRNGNLDPTPDYICDSIVATQIAALGPRFAIQKNQLNCGTPLATTSSAIADNFTILRLFRGQVNIGMQPTWWCFGDPTYRNNAGFPLDPFSMNQQMISLTKGYLSANPSRKGWNEIYRVDAEGCPELMS